MPDIIQLLPDSVANQIAAGEVVQRPASVVKELMENAIDAGATKISLVAKDAGKTLVQVTDNGMGMSETDARMSFERHATSKIKSSEDIFSITTKGFRGEALASIAAIAQVEMRTRQRGAALGTLLEMEASKLKQQQEVQCPEGTTIQVKNLFFNVPARRYFLKSDAVELRHIMDEFQRIVLTHPDIDFVFIHNGAEVFNLPKVPLRQRIVHVFGSRYNEKLVPVEEHTDIVSVTGFVGKPDAAKRTRGEQFFFVNNRFIKNTYLNHAVMGAFQDLLPAGTFPLYLLYLQIDPAQIDINIHPTKTEIKFQDDRSVYAILHAAVRRALGRFSIAPSMDFEQEMSIPITPVRAGQEVKMPTITVNKDYNPFEVKAERESAISNWFKQKEQRAEGWQELHRIGLELNSTPAGISPITQEEVEQQPEVDFEVAEELDPLQMHRRYIVFAGKDAVVLVDQQRAHQRVLYEKYLSQLKDQIRTSQHLLFPEQLHISPADDALLKPYLPELQKLGFELKPLGAGEYEVGALPSEMPLSAAQSVVDHLLESSKHEGLMSGELLDDKIAWAMAVSSGIRYGQMLTKPEMKELVQQLFLCRMPYMAKKEQPTMIQLPLDQLQRQFK